MNPALAAPAPVDPDIAELFAGASRSSAESRHHDAIAMLKTAVELTERSPNRSVPISEQARLHATLANALMTVGRAGPAVESYKAALRLVPHLTGCWCNLGVAHLQEGNGSEAIACLLQAIALDPGHWPSRTNLAKALVATKQYVIAKPLLRELAEERPHDGRVQHDLGRVCFELNEMGAAIAHFHRARELDPTNTEALYWIGAINQSVGDTSAAQAAYSQAAAACPIIRRPAAKDPADFKVLVLYAPFAGNTPAEYLFKDAGYDTDTLALLPGSDIDAFALDETYHAVVNLISDADQAADLLPTAAELVDRIGAPVVNHPDRVVRTTRDAAATMFEDIPACLVPRTFRLAAGAGLPKTPDNFSFPLLIRPAGSHGGDQFEKLEHVAALETTLATHQGCDCYLIEYVDYRSADGHFRKYRFIIVDGVIFPYHLAIGNDWKLHRDSADMRDLQWVRDEERAFLENPDRIFDARHMQALTTIAARIDLDYFGVDCGLDASGNLVVFEVNASMLVHGEEGELSYKDPFIGKIKAAFNGMLARRATATAG